MLHDSPKMAEVFYNEIFVNDDYQLRHLVGTHFVRTILDIGANCGFFSVFARVLFPQARIIAIEPSPIAFEFLEKNTKYLDIELHNIGLGDGSLIDIIEGQDKKAGSGGHVAISGQSIKTKSLAEMCKAWKIDPNDNLIIKVDCEGSERFLTNPLDEEILSRVLQWSIELHYGEKFPSSPTFGFWNKWLDKMQNQNQAMNPYFLRRRLIEKYEVGVVVKLNR